ncbi:MAG: DUF123 domain-containing protein [Ardenticatenaceae bacterium]|nr:DUF123 domain-containing protein [Ardenticatenaceae bacterium]
MLRLRVRQETAVRFGRFRQGQLIEVPAGECLYVGSALRGLGVRLLRHASRTDANQPQVIRADLMEAFVGAGLVKGGVVSTGSDVASTGSAIGKRPKRLHWHIDYLLEQPDVELTHVIALRSDVKLETAVADWLLQDPATFIIVPGLGASDDHGRTHLLGVKAAEDWWQGLPDQLMLLNDIAKSANHP